MPGPGGHALDRQNLRGTQCPDQRIVRTDRHSGGRCGHLVHDVKRVLTTCRASGSQGNPNGASSGRSVHRTIRDVGGERPPGPSVPPRDPVASAWVIGLRFHPHQRSRTISIVWMVICGRQLSIHHSDIAVPRAMGDGGRAAPHQQPSHSGTLLSVEGRYHGRAGAVPQSSGGRWIPPPGMQCPISMH